MKIKHRHNKYKIGKLALVLIVAFSLNSCSNQIKENDWTRHYLKGKVQSYTEISYKAVNRLGNIEKGKQRKT